VARPGLILLEFNELVPRLVDKFMAEGALPNFARLHREAEIHTTEADEDHPYLEPWIQWITVHSGIPYREHRIHDLGDGEKLNAPNIWDVVSDAGDSVWVCGAMNASYKKPLNGWVLPDPWTVKVAPQPAAELTPYFKFISAHVTDYMSKKVPLGISDYLRFVAFMVSHGLSPETAKTIALQLVNERFDKKVGWKRAAILDRMQFDLFRSVYQRIKPRLATFFINSTAHYQHVYWRDMEPEHFQIQPDAGHRAAHEKSILFGYQAMDRLVGEALALAGPDTTVAFCTALSQQPCTIYEEKGGKTFFRARDFTQFLAAVGITAPCKVAPVMSQQFHLDFESEEAARDAEAKLTSMEMPGRGKVMYVVRKGASVFAGCTISRAVDQNDRIEFLGSDRSARFFDLFYAVDFLKSGMHHRDGMLWIRTPARRHFVNPEKVPLVQVAPTLLQLLGLPQPASMRALPIEPPRERRVA
jgi:hypothetical protein